MEMLRELKNRDISQKLIDNINTNTNFNISIMFNFIPICTWFNQTFYINYYPRS